MIKMNKNLKLIALAIGENFSALFTLKYKFRTNTAIALFDLALTFLASTLRDRGFFNFTALIFIALQQVEPLQIYLVEP
jgi:hypothetical protein